jgi:hypothetical protein
MGFDEAQLEAFASALIEDVRKLSI